VALGAVFASVLEPYSSQTQDLSAALSGPTGRHLLGTDQLGRDVLSQMLAGAGPSLIGVVVAVAVWVIVGVSLGVASGYLGGVTDGVINRVVDLLLSLPALVILIVIFGLFPNSLIGPMAVLGLILSSGLVRVVRGVTLTVRDELYVRAARVAGLSHLKIVQRHILPRITATVIVQASVFAGLCLVIESGIAFLGFGIVLPSPSWGGVINEAAQVLSNDPWLLVPSGVILGVTVVAFVLFGNAVRDTSTESWSAPQSTTPRARRTRPAADVALAPLVAYPDDVLLAVEHLAVEFSDRRGVTPVVSDTSFALSKGETLAVLGESGCGKTITALAILGLLPPGGRLAGGRVLFGGQDLARLSRRELAAVRGRRIGYIAQDPMVSLDPTFTVGAQIAEAVRAHTRCSRAQARRRAIELLDAVNMTEPAEVARRYSHQLSGGMLQRCVIALALSGDPELLIADEPTTALDVTIQAEILGLLGQLQRERGMAVLLITHDWGVVASVADRAIVMYAGELVEEATVVDLHVRAAHPYARALLASTPQVAIAGERLPAIAGSVPAPGTWPAGCRFAPRCIEAEDACLGGPIAVTAVAPDHQARCIHAVAREPVRR
jgi:peptide/nickel transport system permease protein